MLITMATMKATIIILIARGSDNHRAHILLRVHTAVIMRQLTWFCQGGLHSFWICFQSRLWDGFRASSPTSSISLKRFDGSPAAPMSCKCNQMLKWCFCKSSTNVYICMALGLHTHCPTVIIIVIAQLMRETITLATRTGIKWRRR